MERIQLAIDAIGRMRLAWRVISAAVRANQRHSVLNERRTRGLR